MEAAKTLSVEQSVSNLSESPLGLRVLYVQVF